MNHIKCLWSTLIKLDDALPLPLHDPAYLTPKTFHEEAKNFARTTRLVYEDWNVTPYVHALVWHIPQFLELYGTIYQFNCQLVEKKNQKTSSIIQAPRKVDSVLVRAGRLWREKIGACLLWRMGHVLKVLSRGSRGSWMLHSAKPSRIARNHFEQNRQFVVRKLLYEELPRTLQAGPDRRRSNVLTIESVPTIYCNSYIEFPNYNLPSNHFCISDGSTATGAVLPVTQMQINRRTR